MLSPHSTQWLGQVGELVLRSTEQESFLWSLHQLEHLREEGLHLPWAKEHGQPCGWRCGGVTPEAVNNGELPPFITHLVWQQDWLATAAFGRAYPAPHWNNTMESTLLAQVWVSQFQSCRHEELSLLHILCQPGCRSWHPPLLPNQCLEVGELALWSEEKKSCPLTPTSGNTLGSMPFISPGQHNRASPTSRGVNQPQSYEHGRDAPT